MAKRRRLSVEDYTVGWICALPIELAAAQEMLNEIHEGFDNHHPNSIYTLGRIADHNVVVACLPKGQMGTNSAATVAARMQSSYPGIRFAVLVGISGGVPTAKADIRLGDVVVSLPEKTHGGVVQYDFGKATSNGLERMNYLNAPPKILLEAVAKVQASHLRGQTRLHEYVGHGKNFESPSPEQDVLFEADYEHAGGETCKDCDRAKTVQRGSREKGIVLHYGTIASGNLVMRSGTERDRVSSELGSVLCFEMEAAGLMNIFGCIVIRGICDYADSHKNKEWQPYASATAAAYAKELLAVIPPTSVAKIRTAEEVFKEKQANQETLSRLPYVAEATFNSYQKQHERTCLDNTRSQVLEEINAWADKRDGASIFWLNGWAGIGKSTIARTIARQYDDKRRLGASFFFSKGGGDLGHAGKFVTTITRQLANNILALQSFICEATESCVDIGAQSLTDQWRQLVVRPLSVLTDRSGLLPFIVVIDALDECDDDRNIRIIIQLLAQGQLASCGHLKVLITSRPTIPIEHELSRIPQESRCCLVLHHLPSEALHQDITMYLEHELLTIAEAMGLGRSWPGAEALKSLTDKASGLFIWCATVCRFIEEGGPFAQERLDKLLQDGSPNSGPQERLNDIYTSVLRTAVSTTYTESEQKTAHRFLRQILGAIVLLSSPLPLESLCKLLQLPVQNIANMLRSLHAILDIPRDPSRSVHLHHPSFRDFLLDKSRCNDLPFGVDEQKANHEMARACLQLMASTLREDICDLKSYQVLRDNVSETQIKQSLPLEAQYACLFWVQHIYKSKALLADNDTVYMFLSEHILHWLEALSWMRRVPEAIRALLSLQSMASDNDCPQLYELIWDAKRLAQANKSMLEQAPLQIYFSALLFAPSHSVIRVRYQDQLRRWMKKLPSIQNDWSPLQQTIDCQGDGASYIAFSPDTNLLASTSGPIVRLWDPLTGDCLHLLQPPIEPKISPPDYSWGIPSEQYDVLCDTINVVNIIVFSKNGNILASRRRRTVYLWATITGHCLGALRGHSHQVNQLAFSCDGMILASTSSDQTVRLWNPSTMKCLHILEGHVDHVHGVAFSPPPHVSILASSSLDGTIRVWDSLTGNYLHVLKTNIARPCTLVFSRDGKMLASAGIVDDVATGSRFVQLWSPLAGQCLLTLEHPFNPVTAIAFSPDSRILASASIDGTVRLWNPISGECLRILEHAAWVTHVTFSSDGKILASTTRSPLNKVRLWDPVDGALLQVLGGHGKTVTMNAFLPSLHHKNRVLASGTNDDCVLIWTPSTEQDPHAVEAQYADSYGIAASPDGEKLASYSWNTVRLWHMPTGTFLQEFKCPGDYLKQLAFTPNGHNLVGHLICSLTPARSKIIWNLSTGQSLLLPRGSYRTILLSRQGDLLVTVDDEISDSCDPSTGQPTQLPWDSYRSSFFTWYRDLLVAVDDESSASRDYSTTQHLLILNDCTNAIKEIALSLDGGVLMWGYGIQVWDLSNRQYSRTFHIDPGSRSQIALSADGTKLAVTDKGEIHLWCLPTGDCLQTLTGHANHVSVVTFTGDGALLASVSGHPDFDWNYSRSTSLANSLRLWNTSTGECLYMLEDIPVITNLSFSTNEQYLKTSLGLLRLDRSGNTLRVLDHGLFVRRYWITHNGENFLWLPSEYQPKYAAVCDDVVVLLCESGRMVFLHFDLD
ncbi:hypothetical protein BJX62DRAFT_243243 [Aspergillus germanicus]